MALERIDPDTASSEELDVHLERYRFAAEHALIGERVLDAACGTGYGRALFEPWADWIGVDIAGGHDIIQADLTLWQGWRDLWYDVFIGLETIEHLSSVENYVEMAKAASRAIVLSTPMIPTVGSNEFHLRDFSPAEVVALFSGDGWQLQSYQEQASIYGLFGFVRKA
jgi:2-polyprenyl-3-methyl-5-hydroxy-6-metoxy-1,4-benzoquinol methylase